MKDESSDGAVCVEYELLKKSEECYPGRLCSDY